MALIILHVGGTVEVSPVEVGDEIVTVRLDSDVQTAFGPEPFARDSVSLRGNNEQVRAFATKILAALPAGAAAEVAA